MKNQKIGLIGAGQMGKPMAINLKKAGYDVYVFDTNKKTIQEMAEHNISTAASSKEVALKVDETIIIMVRDGKQVNSVIFGEEGIVSTNRQGLNIIVCSSISPADARKLGKDVSDVNLKLLNAPVSGAEKGAQAGALTLMVSGDEDSYNKCKPVFEAIGKEIFYFGTKQESAQGAKLANNLILGVNIYACVEGFKFAESMGIDEGVFERLLSVTTGNSWVSQNWAWTKTLFEQKYNQESLLALLYKDLQGVLNEGNVSLPLTGLTAQLVLSKKEY